MFGDLFRILRTDSAVAGEGAGIGMGLVLAGAALSHASFLGAVSVFESLSRTVLTSPGAARTATLLFVLQPAAVFTLAPYSPSPY